MLLEKYHATNPRLFGSVARGPAGPESDTDILVDMDPADGNVVMRASGLRNLVADGHRSDNGTAIADRLSDGGEERAVSIFGHGSSTLL